MAGLLDFLRTPEGAGLLSAVATGLSGARRGAPINNIGRGLVGGLTGYATAQDQIKQDEENALTKQYRQMQMDQMQQTMAKQKGEQAWRAGLPGMMAPKLTGSTDQGRQLAEQNAAFGAEGLPDLVESARYAKPDAPMNMDYGVDKQALQQYMMQPDSPYADKLIEQQLMPSTDKPQLVTVYENGQPVQKWLRPGETQGAVVGQGKPEAEQYKERTVSPDGQSYIKQYSRDGGQTWQQIEGTRPYDIRAASGSSEVNVNAFPKEQFKNERDLRNDFQGLPTTKAFREVQTSYDQIKAALKTPGAASSLTAATKFMKLLDPGSVVRESELGMAMAATGQLDRMQNLYNKWKTGDMLSAAQRADFGQMADQLYGAATDRYNQTAQEYRQMAGEYQLNPDRIAKPVAIEKLNNKPNPAAKLSPSEQQELQQLRARFKNGRP